MRHIFQGMRVALGNRIGGYSAMSHAQSVAVNSLLALSAPKEASNPQGSGEDASHKRKRNGNSSQLDAKLERLYKENVATMRHIVRKFDLCCDNLLVEGHDVFYANSEKF